MGAHNEEAVMTEQSDNAVNVNELADAEVLINEKDEERRLIQGQIEQFLASGGSISEIEPNVMADPPKKPTSNYGGQPI